MLTKEWEEYSTLNAQHTSDSILFWEAGKAYIRGRIISFVATQKNQVQKFKEASDNLRLAQRTYTDDPTPLNGQTWQKCKTDFDIWATKYEISKTNYMNLSYYKFGNKAGKMLSHLVRGSRKPVLIP